MPSIIVPRRHLVQPQGRIEPASEYSSARVLALPGCVWSNRGILPAGIPTQAEGFGQSWVFNGTSHFIDLGAQPALATSFTIGALVWQGTSVNAFAVASRSTASTQGFGLVVGPGSVAGAATCQVGTSGGTYTATPSATGLSARYVLHICTLASGTLRHYVDGVLIGSISVAGTNTPSQNLYLARRGTTYFAGRIGLAFELPEALSAERVAEVSRNPWQLFRRDAVRMFFSVGGGGNSGDYEATDSPDVFEADGDLIIDGDYAATDEPDTFAADGDLVIQGDYAATDEPDVFAAASSETVEGDYAATDSPDVFAADGDLLIEGDYAATDSPDVFAATDIVPTRSTFPVPGFELPSNTAVLAQDGQTNRQWLQWFDRVHSIASAQQQAGPTAARPVTRLWIGRQYFDTDLGRVVYVKEVNPAVWVDGAGTVV